MVTKQDKTSNIRNTWPAFDIHQRNSATNRTGVTKLANQHLNMKKKHSKMIILNYIDIRSTGKPSQIGSKSQLTPGTIKCAKQCELNTLKVITSTLYPSQLSTI